MHRTQRVRPAFWIAFLGVAGAVLATALVARLGLAPRPAQGAGGEAPPPPLGEEGGAAAIPVNASPGAQRPEVALLEGLPEPQATRSPQATLEDLVVSFKLDPRLTQSLYLGERWLSPPTYLQVGVGRQCVIEASVRGLSVQGNAVSVVVDARVSDPDMVRLSPPGPGNTMKIAVLRPGKTTLHLSAQGAEVSSAGPTRVVTV